MYTLRLVQIENQGRIRVEIALVPEGQAPQTATVPFEFKLSNQQQEDLHWYYEDFLQFRQDPAPKIAQGIEKGMANIGTELFRAVFQQSDDARAIWSTLSGHLMNTRIEIAAAPGSSSSIPWELLRDPNTDESIALVARSFVRVGTQPPRSPKVSLVQSAPIRILLVISRPSGGDDVPFRSVASRVIKGLSEGASAAFRLDVLRPSTFEQLSLVLRAAKAEGEPYHILHFDGHGFYGDGMDLSNDGLTVLDPTTTGNRGYLLFEQPALDENWQLVDGTSLGNLLVETEVPVLVLNACRSAYADWETSPDVVDPANDLPNTRVQAYTTLAEEVVDAGVVGVVAMRYNVYVVTAAHFVANVYATLTSGYSLGEAVAMGRKQLASNPVRDTVYDLVRLEDWAVPVVYEAAPLSLLPVVGVAKPLTINIGNDAWMSAKHQVDLPNRPDIGFFGRDETLLALDRALDFRSVVLLNGYAGSGKTSTAVEFARWYSLTGGAKGPVLFTSFEHHFPLPRVLDQIGETFQEELEQAGVQWAALDTEERLHVALQVMDQIPVLWLWDNVESVAGFPTGTPSAWSDAEQVALADFLRNASDTKAKFVLTSRRDERGWLGEDLPRRVALPPMPMQERMQLAKALAENRGRHGFLMEIWWPLLEFTQGNPLTVAVLVRQALNDGLGTRQEIESFVSRLRLGEASFQDDQNEGRSRSLAAALSYGFADNFDESERGILALLYLFRGNVFVNSLRLMGTPEKDWSLSEVSVLDI